MQAGVWPGVAMVKQGVKLAAVPLKFGAFIEDFAKGVLHLHDLGTDTDFTTKDLLDVGRGTQVIGVDVAFYDPLQLQALAFDPFDDLIGIVMGDPSGGQINVHHAINDRAGLGIRVFHQIGDCVAVVVKETLDRGRAAHIDRVGLHFGLLLQAGVIAISLRRCCMSCKRFWEFVPNLC
jgi:hypothetical protein